MTGDFIHGTTTMSSSRLKLPNVQLIAIRGGGDNPVFFLRALRISMGHVDFGRITFLTNMPQVADPDIENIEIPPLDRGGYSEFCIRSLSSYVTLQFCLLIQSDGFVLNPLAWNNRFLDYDYIGAPWASAWESQDDRVGNGGFSLRSKKLLEVCSRFPFPVNTNEDHLICRDFRGWFIEQGVKFAPINYAARFSREQSLAEFPNRIEECFGFHSWTMGRESLHETVYGTTN